MYFLSEDMKSKLRILHPDSDAYSHIDQKCCFCNVKLEKKDAVFPNRIMEACNGELASHHNCLEYILKKYPDVPINKLHGKVIRMRVESARL